VIRPRKPLISHDFSVFASAIIDLGPYKNKLLYSEIAYVVALEKSFLTLFLKYNLLYPSWRKSAKREVIGFCFFFPKLPKGGPFVFLEKNKFINLTLILTYMGVTFDPESGGTVRFSLPRFISSPKRSFYFINTNFDRHCEPARHDREKRTVPTDSGSKVTPYTSKPALNY
jgi:hypothetical protein